MYTYTPIQVLNDLMSQTHIQAILNIVTIKTAPMWPVMIHDIMLLSS